MRCSLLKFNLTKSKIDLHKKFQLKSTSAQHASRTMGGGWGAHFIKFNFTLPKTHLHNNVQLKSNKGRWRGPLIFWIQPSQTKHISTTICTRNPPQATRNLGSDRCSFCKFNLTSPKTHLHQHANKHQNPPTRQLPPKPSKPQNHHHSSQQTSTKTPSDGNNKKNKEKR